MQNVPNHHHEHLAPATRVSRRTTLALAAKLACGVAAAAIASTRMTRVAAAEGQDIVLTATASEVGAAPGSAYAQGSAALAVADQGAGAATVPASYTSSDIVPGSSGRCRGSC
jgi:hypothetical protein